jgi:hypothetical protein
MVIINCTISHNAAPMGGGGIYNTNILTIGNSTVSGNFGGGISSAGAGAVLRIGDTILNAGDSFANLVNSGAGVVLSVGHNLSSDNGSGFLTGPGDQINIDPMLGPLQGNGGPTFTQALLGGSPAIDAGGANLTPLLLSDQRGPGYARVSGQRIDIGSYEVQSSPNYPATD